MTMTLEQKLESFYATYAQNFSESYELLPRVNVWHMYVKDGSPILLQDDYRYHEARFIRLVHALIDRAPSIEVVTSPHQYVRDFGKLKYDKKDN